MIDWSGIRYGYGVEYVSGLIVLICNRNKISVYYSSFCAYLRGPPSDFASVGFRFNLLFASYLVRATLRASFELYGVNIVRVCVSNYVMNLIKIKLCRHPTFRLWGMVVRSTELAPSTGKHRSPLSTQFTDCSLPDRSLPVWKGPRRKSPYHWRQMPTAII